MKSQNGPNGSWQKCNYLFLAAHGGFLLHCGGAPQRQEAQELSKSLVEKMFPATLLSLQEVGLMVLRR